MYLQIFTLLASCVIFASGRDCSEKENSYLWKVKTAPPLYLYGTMHVPYKTLWSYIPHNVKVAFSSSQDLCLELELLDKGTLGELSKCRLLREGVVIDDILPPDLVSRVRAYLEKIKDLLPQWVNGGRKGFSSFFKRRPTKEELFNSFVGDWRKIQPAWLMQLLSQLQKDQLQHSSTPILDTFLEGAAKGLGKRVEALEEPNDLCRAFRQLSKNQVEVILEVLLDVLVSKLDGGSFPHSSSLQDDIDTYRCGNFSALVNHTPILPLPPLDTLNLTSSQRVLLKAAEATLFRAMVTRRNRRMFKAIHDILTSPRNNSVFIGVGAGHFLSDYNIIDRLRAKGHTIELIPADRDIPGLPVPDNIVALGDPSSVVRLLHISPTEPTHPPVTFHQDLLNQVWNKFFTPPSATQAPSPQQQGGGAKKKRSLDDGNLESSGTRDLKQAKRMRLAELLSPAVHANSRQFLPLSIPFHF